MPHDARRTTEPIDRLGRVALAMTATGQAHPEYHTGDRLIVLLYGDDGTAMAHMEGYDRIAEVLGDMLEHLQAVGQTAGLGIDLVTIPHDASALDDE